MTGLQPLTFEQKVEVLKREGFQLKLVHPVHAVGSTCWRVMSGRKIVCYFSNEQGEFGAQTALTKAGFCYSRQHDCWLR